MRQIFHHGHHDHDHGDHDHEHHHHHEPLPDAGPRDVLFIDPVAGASGDMFLGALVDLGVDFEELREGLRKLKVPGFDLTLTRTKRHTIAAAKVDVIVEDVEQPHRHVGDLTAYIEAADLPDRVKRRATAVLWRLAEAESAVHRMPIEKVHLHEVGGLDCLVDIVGTCIGLELLGVDRIWSGPVSVGTGTVLCAHGRMPLPAPGTLAILRGFPIRKTNFHGEMTTPTGAAIISALAQPITEPAIMIPRRIGYGAGTKDKPEIANLLRLVLAEAKPSVQAEEKVSHSHEHHHTHSAADH